MVGVGCRRRRCHWRLDLWVVYNDIVKERDWMENGGIVSWPETCLGKVFLVVEYSMVTWSQKSVKYPRLWYG